MLISSITWPNELPNFDLRDGIITITSTLSTTSTSTTSKPFTLRIENIAFVTIESSSSSGINIVYLESSVDKPEVLYESKVKTLYFECKPNEFDDFLQINPTFSKLCREDSFDFLQSLDIILNTHAGKKDEGENYLNNIIIPLLDIAGINYQIIKTDKIGDVGNSLKRLKEIERVLGKDVKKDKYAVALIGGDGTTHELINDLLLNNNQLIQRNDMMDLVLLPFGTANALYYHLFPPESITTPINQLLSPLYSLLSFLRPQFDSTQPVPLSMALNTFTTTTPTTPSPSSSTDTTAKDVTEEVETKVITSVVSSAALHAAILLDAEELRTSHPGIERFKIAAQKNSTIWWNGKLKLSSGEAEGGKVEKYDSQSKSFVELQEGDEGRILEGPFCYLVSSLVSRFESNFVVAPLRSSTSLLPPSSIAPSIDLILIRPLRDPQTFTQSHSTSASTSTSEAAKGFVSKVWGVLGGMYKGGSHIDARFEQEGEGEKGEGEEIVEYFRCTGFSWEPEPFSSSQSTGSEQEEGKKSNLICLDGTLFYLKEGGKLLTNVLESDKCNIRVWS